MSSILATILIVLAVYYMIANPIKFLFLYGMTAAYNEARGIEGFLSTGVIPYNYIMQFLLFIVFLKCLLQKQKVKKNALTIWMCSVIYIVFVSISCIIGGHLLSVPIYLAQNCPIYILILYFYKDKIDVMDFVVKLVTFHIIMAFLVLYLPIFGINILESIQGYKYIDSIYKMGAPATLGNFYQVFFNKYQFNLAAQFHNPNDTAFFGVIGVVLYYSLFKKTRKIKWFVLIIISAILWVNGGSRSALIGWILGIVATVVMSRNDSKKSLMVLSGIILVTVVFSIDSVQSHIISLLNSKDYGSIYTSVIGRTGLRRETLKLIAQFPIFGTGGEMSDIYINNIVITQYAHELPLRQAALFGIPTGIVSFLIVNVIPLVSIIKKKNYDYISLGFYFILLCTTLTNGFLCPMMVYLLVYVCVFRENYGKVTNQYKHS